MRLFDKHKERWKVCRLNTSIPGRGREERGVYEKVKSARSNRRVSSTNGKSMFRRRFEWHEPGSSSVAGKEDEGGWSLFTCGDEVVALGFTYSSIHGLVYSMAVFITEHLVKVFATNAAVYSSTAEGESNLFAVNFKFKVQILNTLCVAISLLGHQLIFLFQ